MEAHIIAASTQGVKNLEKCVEDAAPGDRFILNPLAAGDIVLTPEEREAGVMIDIGGGTTDLAIFVDGSVAYRRARRGRAAYHQRHRLRLHLPTELAESPG